MSVHGQSGSSSTNLGGTAGVSALVPVLGGKGFFVFCGIFSPDADGSGKEENHDCANDS
jgi:hypothetical protein